MLIDFKGSKIAVKDYDCQFGTLTAERITPFVNLFVKVTKGCNAHCLFCSNAGCPAPNNAFDIPKLMGIITELRDAGVKVNRVNITGGEPSVVSPMVEKILIMMSDSWLSDIHIHLNNLLAELI